VRACVRLLARVRALVVRQNALALQTERTLFIYHHHQPINVPTGGTQAFLINYTSRERAITHHAGPVRVGSQLVSTQLTTANAARTNDLMYPQKHGGARENEFLVTLLMTDL
jgi:hypothetical protein